MKTNLLLKTFSAALLSMMAGTAPLFADNGDLGNGTGTADNPYLIADSVDWNAFTEKVNEGETTACATMTADVGPVMTMAGSSQNMYGGTFDGQGYKLTVDYNTTENQAAPFRVIAGATIKNLHIAGTITTSGKYAGSVAGHAQTSPVTISNCWSEVNIVSSVSGDGTHGGFIGDTDTQTTISDCLFSGSIAGNSTYNCGGFVAWSNNSTTISNSLLTATFSVNSRGCYTFSRNPNKVTVTNSYYANAFGTVNKNATQASSGQLASGEVAYNLQNNRDALVWGQAVKDNGQGTDNLPLLTADAAKRVYKVTYAASDNNEVLAEGYGNAGGVASIPSSLEGLSVTLDGQPFTTETALTGDTTVTVNVSRTTPDVSMADITMHIGDKADITLTGLPDDYDGTITYQSGNSNIISVDGTTLTAKKSGKTTLTATLSSTSKYLSTSVTCNVTAYLNVEPGTMIPVMELSSKTMTFKMVDGSTIFYAAASADGYYQINDGVKPSWYGTNIPKVAEKVVFDASFADARPKYTSYWFSDMTKLRKVEGMEYLNTSETTNMQCMFFGCVRLYSLDLSHLNTENVTNMSYMFYNGDLSSLDLSNFNTSAVTTFQEMFAQSGLETINLSSFTFGDNVNVKYMFNQCTRLVNINIGDNDLKNISDDKKSDAFSNVGKASKPCKLVCGRSFDTSVLGDPTNNYYQWLGGYFTVDTSTAINGVSANKASNDAPRYNLKGQRVGNGYKGIVIMNGKKVIIK